MAEAPIRLVLVDDHAIVLKGLDTLFRQDPRFDVIGCFRDGNEALAIVRDGAADVMILDLRMPGTSGLEVLRVIKHENLSCRAVLLTATITDTEALQALDLGVAGLVLKESSPAELVECVVRVRNGEQWIDRQTMARALGLARRQETGRRELSRALTPREVEIVKLVAQGHRNKGIADRLSISEGTVKIHLHNVYEKIGVDGRLELLLWVKERGLA